VLRIRNASQGGNLSYTLPQLQATHPDAANNLAVDPLFTDEASRVSGCEPEAPRSIAASSFRSRLPWDGSGFGAFEFDGGGAAPPATPARVTLQ